MEILGNEIKEKNILDAAHHIGALLLTTNTVPDGTTNEIANIISAVLDMDVRYLYEKEIISLLLVLQDSKIPLKYPLIDRLLREIKLKQMRCEYINNIQERTNSDITIYNEDTTDKLDPEERFLPTPENNFILPQYGETGNLTVSVPDHSTGKMLIRELIVDHDGYVIKEVSRIYRDIYTNESEAAYNEAYLKDLRGEDSCGPVENGNVRSLGNPA